MGVVCGVLQGLDNATAQIFGQSPTDSYDAHTRRMDTNMALLQGRGHEFYVSNRTQCAGQYIYQFFR